MSSSTFQTLLTDLPNVGIGVNLEQLDFVSILTLRKVSHKLRNFVDQYKPKSNFTDISVQIYPGAVLLEFSIMKENPVTIVFEQRDDSCVVTWKEKKREKALENLNYMDVFLMEFEDLMKYHQPQVLVHFEIIFWTFSFYEKVLKIMQNVAPLQVKSLVLGMENPESCLNLLACFQPEILESIALSIENLNEEELAEERIFDMEEIFKMDQWKKAINVITHSFDIAPKVQKFLNFETASISMHTVPLAELILLKNEMTVSPTPKRFDILFEELAEPENYITVFGESFVEVDLDGNWRKDAWFFQIQNSTEILKLLICNLGAIYFLKINREEVPEDAGIGN